MNITVLALGFVLVLFLVVNAAGWTGTEGNNMLPAVPASIDSGGSSSQSAATPPQSVDPYVLAKSPVPTAAEPQLPVYPGATVVKDQKWNEPPRYTRAINWEANSSYEEIVAFYEERLPQQGWRRLVYPLRTWTETTDEDNETAVTFDPNEDPYSGLTYYWTDDTGLAGYRLRLHLLIVEGKQGSQEVRTSVRRIPNENKIPLYSDAEQIEVSGDSVERTVTYLSNTPPTQIVDFYGNLAPEYGWTGGEAEQRVIRLGYHEVSMEPGVGPWLSCVIAVSEHSQGKTKVEIRIEGLDSFSQLREGP